MQRLRALNSGRAMLTSIPASLLRWRRQSSAQRLWFNIGPVGTGTARQVQFALHLGF